MKLKLQKQDEFVIGGWTAPQGTRLHFGALMLGAKGESGELDYTGDVGTGFTGAELERLIGLLKRIETLAPQFGALSVTNHLKTDAEVQALLEKTQ